MKNIFKSSLAILLIVLLGYSCSNDDEEVIITLENLSVTVDENPINGEVLGTIEANGSNVTFSITSQTPNGALAIDTNSGEVIVLDAGLFDYETNAVLTATIAGSGAEGTATVTVNLNNLSELTAQDLTVAADENPANGDAIGTVQAMADATPSFSITGETPVGALAIDASSGEVTVLDAGLFDFEANPVITADVLVDNAGNTETVTVTVNLNNVNELNVQDFTVAIDENPTDGQAIGTVQATGGGTLVYSITSQTPTGALAIDAGTGELTVVDPNIFDYETNPVITASVAVSEASFSETLTATINLNDVDEVTATNTNLSIDEDPSNGDIVGTLQASGSNLTYAITFQNPTGAFNINASTGELSVADETLFDFEINPNMLATISVDNGIQSVSANAFVALNDVNEIGEFKYGGVIFWIDPSSNNSEGLVCAISDQGTDIAWGCSGTLISGTSSGIGSGQANTSAIIAGCSTTGIAAEIVSSTTIEGYSDWFLPSIDELNEMYVNRASINATANANGGTSFSIVEPFSTLYLSSTEIEIVSNTAQIISFANGSLQNANKGVAVFSVRAVRAFTDN